MELLEMRGLARYVAAGLVAVAISCSPQPSGPVMSESRLTGAARTEPVDLTGLPGDVDQIIRLMDGERPVRYQVDVTVRARSAKFSMRVEIDPHGRVASARVLTYSGMRGRQVGGVAFGEQFTGKTSADAVRVGRDVDAVSGATSSSRAFSGGVRRALQAVDAIRGR
jgi:Na+-translocating ferredoxin:NAD+ oxidoreductase RnfG subunit